MGFKVGDKDAYLCRSCFDGQFNEPVHYHKYEIDTIEFLQKGFPPEVFRGFAIGSIIKYLHRAQEKNGLEDYLKAEDYTKRLYKFEKEIDEK
jgi:hypothetical protein